MRIVSRKPADVAPPRLGPLAKLPVFFDLAGRRAVVAGGSPGAAWKAELLASAGARVDVYAAEPCAEMLGLLDRGAAAGSLTLHCAAWTAADLDGAALAIGDVEDDAEAFAEAARAAGVPVNVVDKPALCDFQIGSIVNRSPIIVGISTDGAAPILGQAIRQRIEVLLHPSLVAWGALAKSIRGTVMRRLADRPARRAFWERFADRALLGGAPDADGLFDGLERAGPAMQGSVTLVGAGPGDAELLTLKAVRALQAADVILFDDLVPPSVLELARREARRMLVGKRGGRSSCAQVDINELMLRLARQGRRVVRLKSGDPMIFGRAGEEIERLRDAGISVEVVPGITAASAMAAALQVSLTHRDLARSVRLVTGCAKTGDLPEDLDWRGLADPGTTTVFYMAGRTAGRIAARLIQAGLPEETPAVIASNVSRGDAACWWGRLADLGAASEGAIGAGPVLIGIGSVFATQPAMATQEASVGSARR